MDYAQLRKRMVDEQLVERKISDRRILNAFLKVERHRFVPEELKVNAYADCPLPIGHAQTISQPYIVALMTEALNLKQEDKVLEIGTGSGYQTAILAELCKEVISIERLPSLAKDAESLLNELGYANVRVAAGDGTLGYPDESPFDKVIITAATPIVPTPLIEQLRDPGRLVAPLGERFSQILTAIDKKAGKLEHTQICACVFVPLVGKYGCKE
jgi:protein-L-isoaspartate(D-aspartate) O-methyltransferase